LQLTVGVGPVLLFVRDGLIFRGRILRTGTDPFPLLVSCAGTDPVRIEAPFDGTLVAPYAKIDVESVNGVAHRGAFFGFDVQLRPGARLIHEPFLAWVELDVLSADTEQPAPAVALRDTAGSAPSLAGSGSAQQRVEAFMVWMVQATIKDADQAQARIAAVQGNQELAQALIGHFNGTRHAKHSQALLTLGVLGQLRALAGEQFFIDLLNEPAPTDGPIIAKRGRIKERQHVQYQAKAVHGLAFADTVRANNTLIGLMKDHGEVHIRSEAVRAHIFNQPASVREGLASRLRPDEQHFLDRFENRNVGGTTYNDRLQAYIAKHPEISQ
jgi:hypothetical protein